MAQTILVVEDDNGLQKYLKELLLDNGFSVQTVPDGVQALNSIAKLPPELVLLDLGLPNMSGEAVCTEIRKKYPDLQVIILTAKDGVADIVHGLDLGADDYLVKPFHFEELFARVKALLKRADKSPDDEKIKQMVLSNYHESYGYLQSSGYFEDNAAWFNQYMSIPKAKPRTWMSNKFIPFTHSKVESGAANLMAMYFQNKPVIEIKAKPFGKGDAYHAGQWRQVLHYQAESESFYTKFMQYIKNVLIYGTAIGKVYWSNAIRKIKVKIRKINPVKDFLNTIR